MPDDSHDILHAYFDGQLDAEGYARLDRLLASDPGFALQMARYGMNHHALERFLLQDAIGELVGEDYDDAPDVMSEVVEQALALRRHHELEEEANRLLAAQQQEDARDRRFELRRQAEPLPVKREIVIPRAVAGLGVAAVLGLVAWIAIYLDQSTQSQTPPPPGPAPQAQEETMPALANVAFVRSSVDARWSARSLRDSAYLKDQTAVTLSEGLAEVVFGDGAAVIVQGPATFEPAGPNGMRLVAGRIVATVPVSAHGFTVATPAGLVTDYGTEFGVIVNHDGQALAHTFSGRIGLTPNGGQEAELLAGEAVIATPRGQLREVEHDALAFVRGEEYTARRDAGGTPYARWLAYSYELRRDPALMAYFVPDRAAYDQAQLPNLRSGSNIAAALDGPSLVPGRFGEKQALGFASDNDICAFSDSTATDDLTLAAWVWIDAVDTSLVMLMGTEFWETPGATHWQLEVAGDGRSWGMSLGSLAQAEGEETKAISGGILSPDDRGRWVHLAVVADASAGQARFYVDGAVRDVQPYRPGYSHVLGNARIGTLRGEDGRSAAPYDRHLDGRIDEMVILSRPMSDGDVWAMYSAGRPPGGRPADN